MNDTRKCIIVEIIKYTANNNSNNNKIVLKYVPLQNKSIKPSNYDYYFVCFFFSPLYFDMYARRRRR